MWSNDDVRAQVRCPCYYPGNFLKPCSQSVRAGGKWWLTALDRRVKQTQNKQKMKHCHPLRCDPPEVSRPRRGGVRLCGRVVFSVSLPLSLFFSLSLSLFWRRLFFISAFQSVLLIYKPSRNVREWKNRSALPCACSVVVPPVLFVLLFFDKYIYNYFFSFGYWFFFLCFYRVGENSGTRRDWVRRTEVAAPRKLQTPTERVGLVTAERGIVPLVCDDLNGRDSSGPKPRPRLKTEVIQL